MTTHYRWPTGTCTSLVATAERGVTRYALRLRSNTGITDAAVDAALLPVMQWLCAQSFPWSLEQARAAVETAQASSVDALVARLSAQGLLEITWS